MNIYLITSKTLATKIQALRTAGYSAVVEADRGQEAIRTDANYDQMRRLFPRSQITRVY